MSPQERAAGPVDSTRSPHARLRTLAYRSVSLSGGFWAARQATNRQVSLPHGYRMLEEWGNFDNLRLAAGLIQGKQFRGYVFQDSDVYKWLEAVAYELANRPDAELQAMADEAIALVEAAQAPDGYLDSHYQVAEPSGRWVHLDYGHELYCAGHLFQAAVAWRRATGDTRLLRVAERLAGHIDSLFGPGKRAATPGHPEVEMALVELYRETLEPRYLALAHFFVDQRGHGLLGKSRYGSLEYFQDHVPVRQASTVVGHAVRQLYLTAGVTDLYLETGEEALLAALERQWHDMVERKLALTGGVGARHEGEAFGEPYELPNDACYCETCAAIASILWNWRMLLATGQARFADLMERTLYNGFLSGVGLDGRHFYYVNPLLSRGGIERPEWYACACCPPNVMRLLASFGHYLATSDASGVQLHHYAPATIDADGLALRMETEYPWQGLVRITVERATGAPRRLALRVPGWCDQAALRVNGQAVAADPTAAGYAAIERAWQPGDTVELELPMAPRLVEAHPRVDATRGSLAIERGPLVYCLEQADQDPAVDVMDVEIDPTRPLDARWRGDLLGGVMAIEAPGYALDLRPWQGRLYRPLGGAEPGRRAVRLVAVPYYAWANRGPGAMRVWVPAAR